MVVPYSARIEGGTLTIKQGIRTFKYEISKLLYLYVRHQGSNRSVSLDELMLCYQPKPGQKKVKRLLADKGAPGLQGLTAALVALRPDIDIRHLDAKAAHKAMGATNVERMMFFIMPFVIAFMVGVGLLPSLLHGIDNGEAHVSITQLDKGVEPSSHNVVISGVADLDDAMFDKKTDKNGTTIDYYVPIVPAGWKKTDPIHVVLKTGDLGPSAQLKLHNQKAFPGVMDDILWEGLDSKVHDFFTGHMGLKLADNAKVVDYQEDSQSDLFLYLVATGGTFLFMVILMPIVAIRMKRRRG